MSGRTQKGARRISMRVKRELATAVRTASACSRHFAGGCHDQQKNFLENSIRGYRTRRNRWRVHCRASGL